MVDKAFLADQVWGPSLGDIGQSSVELGAWVGQEWAARWQQQQLEKIHVVADEPTLEQIYASVEVVA